MKLFLDDARAAPEGWTRAYLPDKIIELLKMNTVEIISLDHDLGDDEIGTGYDVIIWIEKAVIQNNFKPPEIIIHTANISARKKMELGLASINYHLKII